MAGTNRNRRASAADQCRQDQKIRTAPRYRGETRRRARRVGCRRRYATRELIMDVEKGTRQLKSLIEKLERNNRTLRSHPTIEKIERGELSQPQLRHWATQLFIGNKPP